MIQANRVTANQRAPILTQNSKGSMHISKLSAANSQLPCGNSTPWKMLKKPLKSMAAQMPQTAMNAPNAIGAAISTRAASCRSFLTNSASKAHAATAMPKSQGTTPK